MAGRKPLDRELLSIKVLDAAEAMIADRGLGAVNARNVASKAGCSVGTLYNIFGSRDRLIRVLNTRTLDRLYEALKESSTEGKSVDERMIAMAVAYIDFANRQPEVWRAVFEHKMPESEPKVDWYVTSIEHIATLGVTVLAPFFKSGDIRTARHIATLIWSGVHGICSLAQSGSLNFLTQENPKSLAEDLIRGYLAGLSEEANARFLRHD